MIRYLAWIDRNVGVVIVAALLLAVALFLAGCGGRRQVQDLSDARAGALAYQQEPDPARRAQIAEGVMGHLLAGLEGYPLLPKPTHTPREILTDPAAYAEAGAAAQADPQPYVPDDHQQPEPKPPGVLDRLRTVAGTLLDWGLIAAAIGGVVWGAYLFASWLGWSPAGMIWRLLCAVGVPVARIAALWGSAAAALGAAGTWLADWWWVVALTALAVGGIVVWVHWRDVTAWLQRRRAALTAASTGVDHA